MGTIFTNADSQATSLSAQKKIDRTQNGVLWFVLNRSNSANVAGWYSTDNGATWTGVTLHQAPSNGANNYYQNPDIFIDLDDFMHLSYKDPGSGYIYYVRLTPNTGRTAYTATSSIAVWNSDATFDVPVTVAFRNPAQAGEWTAFVVYGLTTNNTNARVAYAKIRIQSGGTASVLDGNVVSNGGPTISAFPYHSVDFRHTGDGKTVATVAGALQPDIFVAWFNGSNSQTGDGFGLQYRKAVYSNGNWTWNAIRSIDTNASYGGSGTVNLNCMYDGARVIMGGEFYTSVGGGKYYAGFYQRDVDDTATIQKTFDITAAGQHIFLGAGGYDANSVYLFGNSGNNNTQYYKYSRASDSWAGPTLIKAGASVSYVSTRRGTAGQVLDYVYTDGTNPYSAVSGRLQLNQPPTAPTWVTADNTTQNSGQDIPVLFKHNDPDGDSASKWDLRYRAAGTTGAWVTLTGTSSAINGGTITSLIPANTVGGVLELQARTYDPSGTAGAWSTSITMLTLPNYTAGGVGGTSLPYMTLYNMTQSERALRALGLA